MMTIAEGSVVEDLYAHGKQKTFSIPNIPHNRRLISSCCKASDCRAGDREFKL